MQRLCAPGAPKQKGASATAVATTTSTTTASALMRLQSSRIAAKAATDLQLKQAAQLKLSLPSSAPLQLLQSL